MKIAILICGQFRALHKVYEQFDKVLDADYFLSIDHEIDDYNILKECPKIRQIIFQEEVMSNEFRNVKNYTRKISNGCKILPKGYEYYIIIRSDLIIENPNFLHNIIKNFSLKYIFNKKDKI